MDSFKPNAKHNGKAPRAFPRLLMLLSLLLIFTFTAAVPGYIPPAKAAEPDLALLKSAFASSILQEQLISELGSPRVIPAAAFNADTDSREWYFALIDSYLRPSSDIAYCGTAPVYLPDRSLITSFEAYVLNASEGTINMSLYAKPLMSMADIPGKASISSNVHSDYMQLVTSTAFQPILVNNAENYYYIGACLVGGGDLTRLYSVQVGYKLQSYLPMISH